VKTPQELEQLANELNNSMEILTNIDRLHEIDTQNSIVEIANRMQLYIRNRWKKFALEKKTESQRYPDFKHFVEFVCNEASEANDPVYGQFGTHMQSSDSLKTHSSSFMTGVNKLK
jgi:hypothetical protein